MLNKKELEALLSLLKDKEEKVIIKSIETGISNKVTVEINTIVYDISDYDSW